jgi:cobalt-precorrin-5B (C1)-methyltransferase
MTALRRGWTTGACATACAKAAYVALASGQFPNPVQIALPGGRVVAFPLAHASKDGNGATAGIIKDAGDDPDVTHGALVLATMRRGERGGGVVFRAGLGVGTVTKPGLPVPVGEPAINPVPRAMMRTAIAQAARELGDDEDVVIEIAIPGGEELAKKTMNARLGILGGLSILGTTGIVIPYSCSAWIASIHEGIDVARASGIEHIAGSTGSTSEAALARIYALPQSALIEMGDFVGGMLKYLRRNPVARVTIAGGFAKIAKLAQGHLDLHSARTSLDLAKLASLALEYGANDALALRIAQANTGLEAQQLAFAQGIALGEAVATRARETALDILKGAPIELDVLVVDREGMPIGQAEGRRSC